MDSSHNHDRTSRRVGLVYDDRMCQHSTPNGKYHIENPNRIKAIWSKLEDAGIPQRCEVFSAQEAEDRHIELVHTKKYIDLIKNISSRAYDRKRKRNKIAAGFNSIYLNKGSSQAAYLAAGSVIEVSERVAKGELNSAVAIVRPPGHHAEPDEAMGFCLFNNVAIAASSLLLQPELGVQKILIVDWDVHHGNGTQKMFWKDPRVLFFSVHRFDFGSFYPSGDDGSHSMVGEGLGAGYNVNVPWEDGGCGDADYFAVWDHILIPIAKAFNPDMILISGGFDAAVGDPLGGCRVTPYGYSIMMKKLMEFAHGRIMMALEGGYNLDSLAKSVLACVETLLEDKPILGSSEAYPFESTWRVIQLVRQELSTFWPILTDELPKDLLLTTNKTPPVEELAEGSEKVYVIPEEVDHSTSALDGQEKTIIPNNDDVVHELLHKIEDYRSKGSGKIVKSTSVPEDAGMKLITPSPDVEKSFLKNLENNIVFTQRLFGYIRDLEDKLGKVASEKDLLISQEKDRENKYKKLSDKHRQTEELFKKQVTELQEKIGNLETLTLSQSKEINLLKSENVSLGEEKLILEKEKSDLKTELDQAKIEKSDLKTELDQVKICNATNWKEIEDTSSGLTDLEKLEIIRKDPAANELFTSLCHHIVYTSNLENEFKKLQVRNDDLEKNLKTAENTLITVKNSLSAVRKDRSTLTKQVASLTEEKENLEKSNKLLTEEKATLTEEIATLTEACVHNKRIQECKKKKKKFSLSPF